MTDKPQDAGAKPAVSASRNLLTRFITVGFMLPVVLSCVVAGGWGWFGLVFFVAAVSVTEIANMAFPARAQADRTVAYVLGTGMVLASFLGTPETAGIVWCLAFMGAWLWCLARPGNMEEVPRRVSFMILPGLYMGLLLGSFYHLRSLPTNIGGREYWFHRWLPDWFPPAMQGGGAPAYDNGWMWIFIAFLIVWGGDTSAYFAGRFLGKHKLYEVVSPKKTVEGAIGGLVGGFLFCVAGKYLFFPPLPVMDIALIALPIGAVGQAGDLCESMLKRAFGAKDSGWIMPGHGGFLDRIDALVFAAPLLYLYARYVFPVGG